MSGGVSQKVGFQPFGANKNVLDVEDAYGMELDRTKLFDAGYKAGWNDALVSIQGSGESEQYDLRLLVDNTAVGLGDASLIRQIIIKRIFESLLRDFDSEDFNMTGEIFRILQTRRGNDDERLKVSLPLVSSDTFGEVKSIKGIEIEWSHSLSAGEVGLDFDAVCQVFRFDHFLKLVREVLQENILS